jgi:hypothetical protein
VSHKLLFGSLDVSRLIPSSPTFGQETTTRLVKSLVALQKSEKYPSHGNHHVFLVKSMAISGT